MALSYLMLGSNSANKKELLVRALAALRREFGNLIAVSSIYETAAWGYHSDNHFYNQALSLRTSFPPLLLLEKTQKIERQLGRVSKSHSGEYHDRPIDIDILFYGNSTISLPQLTVPHPLISQRRFVLEPLCEIAPNFPHPTNGKTASQLLMECDDTLPVRRLTM